MAFTYTTQRELRAAFWEAHRHLHGIRKLGPRGRVLPQNSQPCDVRMAWIDWVDAKEAGREISPALAQRATL
jgi:hypothetical protein